MFVLVFDFATTFACSSIVARLSFAAKQLNVSVHPTPAV